jgi:hypothetical protein
LLWQATADCGRIVQPHEIEDAVRNSDPDSGETHTHNGNGTYIKKVPIPHSSEYLVDFAKRHRFSLGRLLRESLIRSPQSLRPTEILSDLLGEDATVCVGYRVTESIALAVTDARLDDPWLQFVVPARVKGKFRKRCNDQFEERSFLVLDFDQCDKNAQSSFIWYLAHSRVFVDNQALLRMVVDTGGTGTHAWFDGAHLSPKIFLELFRKARKFGACKSTLTKCQWFRMPNAFRQLGWKQRVLYYSPKIRQAFGKEVQVNETQV